ncbi:MAG: DUF308 domain-containing protein [Muribaculaceae bacterium]|nr:DUF308 domain-containing protein [Muribaculaceae bacterium]
MDNFTFRRGITRMWWMPFFTGLLSVVIGIWCLCSPEDSLMALAYAFSICILAAGLINSYFAIVNRNYNHEWGWNLALGLFEIIIGAWMFWLPEAQLVATFIYAVGIYLVFVCIMAICSTFTLHSTSTDWTGWLIALLLCTLVFAFVFLMGPVAGGIAVWLYIGISFITFGIYRMILALKLKRINGRVR